MTVIASLSVATEADAIRLVEAIGDDEALGFPSTATTEQADRSWNVDVYFEDEADEPALAAIVDRVLGPGAGGFLVGPLPDEDWVAKSLEGLKPVRAGRFLVHGSHDRGKVQANDIAIEIEAGQAFGTGHHGTTAGCLAEIDRLGRLKRRFDHIIDLGTGTGVLAIAIAKAWGVPVLATDIDPVAVRVALENADLNGVGGLVGAVTATGFRNSTIAREAPFDLIVANILAGPLIDLAPTVARHLAKDAVVILSGILAHQGARVIAAYRSAGLRLARRREREGWLTLTFSAGGASARRQKDALDGS